MNDHSAGYAELPRTVYLENTLRRARTAAEQRSHRYVTPEHLLLALVDDPDAAQLLEAVDADIAVIRAAVADTVNHRMSALVLSGGPPPIFSSKFDTLFLSASEDALRTGRREVDGALALIAVAKDPESNASAILAAHGFHWQMAFHALSAVPPPQPARSFPGPPRSQEPQSPQIRPTHASAPAASIPPIQSPRANASDRLMQDMLASVRNILDAEERKERGLPPVSGPARPQAPPPERSAPPRREPQFGTEAGWDGLRAGGGDPAGDPYHAQEAPSYPGRGEPPASPAFSPPDKHRRGRGRGERPSPLAKLLRNVPRKARMGAPQAIRVQLTKEEAGFLLARASRRGQPRLGPGAPAICRAVTVRLTAPEGGFLIEPSAPETQWIGRQASLGEEVFGSWAWTAVPGETGSYILAVSMSARDIDQNGEFGDLQVPDQFIKVHIRRGLLRLSWGFIRTALLLLAGSGLTACAWYALKIMGKLPH